ncbi:unnamed protein product [Pylaiella littoralis]
MAGRSSVPQALEVEQYAQARIQELELLDAAVATVSTTEDGGTGGGGGSGGGGLGHDGGLRDQSKAVPRHMRRRTTSHKPRRMPVALKNNGARNNRSGKAITTTTTTTTTRRTTRREGQRGEAVVLLRGSSGGGGRGSGNRDGEDTMDVEEVRRCRKHRRRPRALLAMHSPHDHVLEEEEEEEEDVGGSGGGGGEREEVGDGSVVPTTKNRLPAPRWLETHIWHAKRMHMELSWGFMLPAKSNRGPRAAVEAALKHCTLQDMTFMRPLELWGPRWAIAGALSAVTDPLDSRPTQESCMDGFVEAQTYLYRVNNFPLGCIAPVSVLWSPADPATETATTTGASSGSSSGGGSCNTPEEEDAGAGEVVVEGEGEAVGGAGMVEEDVRRVWLWVHPAAAKEALRELRKACALGGAPWQGAVQATTVPGGLCRLRVRGARSHEVVQRVLRTAAAAPVAGGLAIEAPAGVGFEDTARDNAAHWRALELSTGRVGAGSGSGGGGGSSGSGSLGQRQLPPGSVLAITALDPREQRQRKRTARTTPPRPPAPVSSSTAKPSSSSTREGNSKSRNDSSRSAAAAAATAHKGAVASAATSPERWPPRWAGVSPLWDPDARALSARLAAARPDHVINETRRRERALKAWDNGSGTLAGASGTAGSAAAQAAVTSASRRFSSSGSSSGGAAPVILVSASGVPTTAHGDSAPTASTGPASRFSGDGRDGGCGGAKEVERKRRVITMGWDLILSPGWAPVFFSALVMAGARALSMKDADDLIVEAGEARFPADFPDTMSGRRHWDEVGRSAAATWTRTRAKHRGFKRPPHHSPPTRPLKTDECGRAASGGGDESGGGGGASEDGGGAEEEEEEEEEEVLVRNSKLPPPSRFRPNFRLLTGAAAAAEAGSGGPRGEEEREPFAVARGLRYVRAFLPTEEREDAAAAAAAAEAAAAVDDSGDADDDRTSLLLSSPLPLPLPLLPLRLAFPTALELVIVQDKGVPKAGATVFAATPRHHSLWVQGRREGGKPWPGCSSLSPPPPPSLSSSSSSVYHPQACGGSGTTAHLAGGGGAIGATTSGGFSFLRGGGAGRAICEAVAVRDAFLLSLSCCGRQGAGGGGGGDGDGGRRLSGGAEGRQQQQQQQRQPWALVLIGNDAGDWLRPAVACVAVC